MPELRSMVSTEPLLTEEEPNNHNNNNTTDEEQEDDVEQDLDVTEVPEDEQDSALVGLVVSGPSPRGHWALKKFPAFQVGHKPATRGNPLPAVLARHVQAESSSLDELWSDLMQELDHQMKADAWRRFYVQCTTWGGNVPCTLFFWWLSGKLVHCVLLGIVVTTIYSKVLQLGAHKPLVAALKQDVMHKYNPRWQNEHGLTLVVKTVWYPVPWCNKWCCKKLCGRCVKAREIHLRMEKWEPPAARIAFV